MPVRVLIVDDSALMRSFLREVLAGDPGIEVVGVASDPDSARQKIKALNPTVITLDIEMPGMDGLTFLEHLMRLRPMPVVMVSSITQRGALATLRALEIGAVDFVAKPSGGMETGWPDFTAEIIGKVKSAASAAVPLEVPDKQRPALCPPARAKPKIVFIGGSTGSVAVLQHVIGSLPADGPAMLAAVHMPAQFTRQFAARLDGLCAMSVCEAADGMAVEAGHVYIAPGTQHLIVVRNGPGFACRLENGPRVNGHAPSVDVLFESAANAVGRDALGIILTGMGKDGAIGLRAMKEAGAITACQDAATSLIYGMPGAAMAEGAVRDELPLTAIPDYIMRHAASPRRAAAESLA